MKKRLKRVAGVVASLLLMKVACVAGFEGGDDSLERLRYLEGRIAANELDGLAPPPPFDGEWRLGTLSMTAAAATNLAFRDPAKQARLAHVAATAAERMLGSDIRAYDSEQWRGSDALATLELPEGHAGYLGHVAFALGAACVAGHPVAADVRAKVTQALARRLDASPTGQIETYPGEVYLMDNAAVVAALRVSDVCDGTHHFEATVQRWVRLTRERFRDAATGLMSFAPGQPARGSGAGWNTFFLPFVDGPLDEEQYRLADARFLQPMLFGAVGWREVPAGDDWSGDVDSGPVLFGLSPSATGFSIAGAARRGDAQRLAALGRTAEVAGFTVVTPAGRRYALAPLVGDAIVLAMKTATPWDARYVPNAAPSR